MFMKQGRTPCFFFWVSHKNVVKSLYMMSRNSVDNLKMLLTKAKQGDQNAFGDIYSNYFVPVYRYIYIRTGRRREDAEELTQEVFLRVFGSLSNLKIGDTNPLAYFFTSARNILIDFYRKSGRVEQVEEEILDNVKYEGASAAQLTERRELGEAIAEAMEILTDDQREVITLKFINELENKEIAEITGKKEEAIRQLQKRALARLRQYLTNNN